MKFTYLTALYNWKRNSAPKGKSVVLGLKLLFTTIGIITTTIFLMKIYEVPVYHTAVSLKHNCDSAAIRIQVVRDFDRRNHISSENIDLKKKGNSSGSGYIDISGVVFRYNGECVCKDSLCRMDSSFEEKIRNQLSLQIEKCDTCNTNIDSIGAIVYTKVYGTKRQFFRLFNVVEDSSFIYFKEAVLIDQGIEYESKDYCDYSYISKIKPNNLYVCETIDGVNKNDSVLAISYRYSASSFEKPNFFMTAEDFSKLVEEIHFDSLSAKEIKRLDIDYKGAADFGVLVPSPDSITISSIHYYSPEKINQIAKDGLKYQARLPEMENMQEVRIFFATMVLAGLFGVFFSLLYSLLKPWALRLWQKKSQNLISWAILLSIILFIFIIYFIYISRPASKELEELPVEPFTEINT